MMNRFAWASARTVPEAAAAATTTIADAMTQAGGSGASPSAIVKAGGVDVLDLMKGTLLAPGTLVDLRNIPGLDAVEETPDGGLRIGATVTLAALATHPAVSRRYPALAAALAGAASPQIRAVATLAGNLLQRPRCWYFRAVDLRCLRKGGGHCFAIAGESQYHAIFGNHLCAIVHPSTAATVLVALAATIELVDADDAARRVPLESFFVAPDRDPHRENDLRRGEILTAIILPPPAAGLRTAFLRQSERSAFDWPLAEIAVALVLDASGICTHASLVLGAAAPVPHRATAAESIVRGRRLDDHVAREAGRAALAGATPLAGNAYKLPLFETLTRRAILAAAAAAVDDARA